MVCARLVQAVALATGAARAAKLRARQRLVGENEGCEKPNVYLESQDAYLESLLHTWFPKVDSWQETYHHKSGLQASMYQTHDVGMH